MSSFTINYLRWCSYSGVDEYRHLRKWLTKQIRLLKNFRDFADLWTPDSYQVADFRTISDFFPNFDARC